MTDSDSISAGHAELQRYIWASLVAWTIVAGLSLAWNLVQIKRDTLELARIQARVAHAKDVVYRRWNSSRSPVYVAQSSEAPPNPYLSAESGRDVVTPSGVRLTMMNPAYMTRQVHELTREAYGTRGHITSLNPIRPENGPDPWERKALEAVERGASEVSSTQKMDSQEYMRLLRPLVTEQGCLRCHAAQGYRLGDIRGGISVSIPMAPLWGVAQRYMTTLSLGHALIWLTGVCGIVLAGRRLRAGRRTIEAQNVQLADSNRQLQEAYGRLDQEFRAVADVQVSLLPPEVPQLPGFQVATHYRPATQAGGDYFDFFPVPGGQWGFMVADVSGHGAPAAVVMAMTRVIMHISRERTPSAQVLAGLNADLLANVLAGHFVTACYGVLDPVGATFQFSSAGHPMPILFDPDSGRAELCSAEGGLPLGLSTDQSYPTASISIKPGSVLLFYTDGITEAFDEQREQYGHLELMNVLQEHHDCSASELKDALVASLDQHRGLVPLEDDVTLVIVRVLPVTDGHRR